MKRYLDHQGNVNTVSDVQRHLRIIGTYLSQHSSAGIWFVGEKEQCIALLGEIMEDTRARRAMAAPDMTDLAGLLARLLTEGKPSKEITLSNGDIGIP